MLIQENISAEPCLPDAASLWYTSSNVLDTEIDLVTVSDKENRKAVEILNCALSTSEIKMMH